ncbi:hypothetical protein B0H34DRAFT_784715 [Crassisporium funariophilum]|nr:hypothetical protein B0H34DRAFT_784715 [Crassisporium funariophilum]
MSQSRSPTPTHNLSTTNIAKSPVPTTSRPQNLDENHSENSTPTGERRRPLTLRLSSPPSLLEPQVAESSSRRRSSLIRPAESLTEEHMAKRVRRDLISEARGKPERHSSPSSDSQDDMADNEMDVGNADRQEPHPPATSPPKKKRTRTLTTPHQSAVLHALLAQSRFPTTAMREEVGRSIGLSARKVQNQRQKARRPRSQSDAPLNRPPQYGPFPSAPESVTSGRGFEERHGEHMLYQGQPPPELHSGTIETPARLLGPGMPGAVVYSPQSYRRIHAPPVSSPPTDPRYSSGSPFQRTGSPQLHRSPRMYPLAGVRPATSQPSSWRERDPSRTLPPLLPSRPSSSNYTARRIHPPSTHSYHPSSIGYVPPRSSSPEPRFAHLPPDSGTRATLNLPPPFTLQPSPQWDEASYTTLPRPNSSPWSRPVSRSTRGRSTSPVAVRREHMGSAGEPSEGYHHAERNPHHLHSASSLTMPPSSSAPPSRAGRYDPVRAIFISHSTPPSTSAPSGRTGSETGDGPPDIKPPPPKDDR